MKKERQQQVVAIYFIVVLMQRKQSLKKQFMIQNIKFTVEIELANKSTHKNQELVPLNLTLEFT